MHVHQHSSKFIVVLTIACIMFVVNSCAHNQQVADNTAVHAIDNVDARYRPKIDVPDEAIAGEFIPVAITVGAEELYPSTEEEHIIWIALYRDDMEVARVHLHTVHSMPKAVFTIALEKSATLRAVAKPNRAGTLVASKHIAVKTNTGANLTPPGQVR